MWYFDSWAVKDGLAFASERTAEQITSASTVFLSVPDLEPVPIGRISTALRATRSNFQDGFRNQEGDEVGFDNLDQVREVIRRAYLASGLGPVGVAEVPPPEDPFLRDYEVVPPVPTPPPYPGGDYYEHRLHEIPRTPWNDTDFSYLRDPKTRLTLLHEIHQQGGANYLHPYIQAFGEATVIECARRFAWRLNQPEERGLFQQWANLLIGVGLWDSFEDFAAFVSRTGLSDVLTFLLSDWHFPWTWRYGGLWRERREDPGAGRLLFKIPSPLRSSWSTGIRVLSDKLLLALTDRDYFAVNHEMPEFIPALFCSMVIVASTSSWSGNHQMVHLERHRFIGRALRWLSHELPAIELPPAVEMELSKYAWRQIGEGTEPAYSSSSV